MARRAMARRAAVAALAAVAMAAPILNPLDVVLIHAPERASTQRHKATKSLLAFFRDQLGVERASTLPSVFYHPDLANASAGCDAAGGGGATCGRHCSHAWSTPGAPHLALHLLGCQAAHRNAWAKIGQCEGFDRPASGYYAPSDGPKPAGCDPLREDGACLAAPKACEGDAAAAAAAGDAATRAPITDATPYTIVVEDDAAVPRGEAPAVVTARLAALFAAGVREQADLLYLGHCNALTPDRCLVDAGGARARRLRMANRARNRDARCELGGDPRGATFYAIVASRSP